MSAGASLSSVSIQRTLGKKQTSTQRDEKHDEVGAVKEKLEDRHFRGREEEGIGEEAEEKLRERERALEVEYYFSILCT